MRTHLKTTESEVVSRCSLLHTLRTTTKIIQVKAVVNTLKSERPTLYIKLLFVIHREHSVLTLEELSLIQVLITNSTHIALTYSH
jgi:hypothetical protein